MLTLINPYNSMPKIGGWVPGVIQRTFFFLQENIHVYREDIVLPHIENHNKTILRDIKIYSQVLVKVISRVFIYSEISKNGY